MSADRTFAEAYTMRSRHFQLLGEAGKLLAQAYLEADAENQRGIKENVFTAMVHSLAEHHGVPSEELERRL